LVFCGLIAMEDPPRPGVKEAVAQCKGAGILPVMITGDHAATAFAIAQRLGMAERPSQVLTGQELDRLDEAQLAQRVAQYRVFARVSPEH
ncbi:MAG: HAD family hydrolase, partial [Acutalibacter sp.]